MGASSGSGAAIGCVVADDHPAVLEAVSRVLEEHGLQVLAAVADGEEAIAALREHRTAVGIIDIKMPRVSGVEVARALAPTRAIILYAGHGENVWLRDGLAAGARGFVLKEAPLDELVRAVQIVAGGGVYLDPVLSGDLVAGSTTQPLTERERSVLRLLADGYRNDAVAKTLFIATDTVRSHMRNAMRKLKVETRTQAVAEALRRSLIE